MAASASKAGGWSDLPAELAGLVLRQLPSYADRARFASVCRHWRYDTKLLLQSPSTIIPPALPWLKILDGEEGTFRSLPDGELHRLPVRPPPLLSANMGRLLFQDAGGKRYLKNPLSGTVLGLPVHSKAPPNLHGLQANSSSSSCDGFQIRKLIACPRDNMIAALISYRVLPHRAFVACCRPGNDNDTPAWSTGPITRSNRYDDMAIFKSRAYAVTAHGDLFEHGLMKLGTAGEAYVEPRVDHVIVPTADIVERAFCGRRSYLVTSACGDKLRMVRWIVPYSYCEPRIGGGPCRCTECAAAKAMEFKVFEAADMENAGGGWWVELESLDDEEVLFVGARCSEAMSISGSTLSSSKIYFADDHLSSWCDVPRISRSCPTRTCGVYDMRTKVISPISDKWPISRYSPTTWFFPFTC